MGRLGYYSKLSPNFCCLAPWLRGCLISNRYVSSEMSAKPHEATRGPNLTMTSPSEDEKFVCQSEAAILTNSVMIGRLGGGQLHLLD